jgi:hypothetical protein
MALHHPMVALLRICNTANNAQQYEDELFQGVIEFIIISKTVNLTITILYKFRSLTVIIIGTITVQQIILNYIL